MQKSLMTSVPPTFFGILTPLQLFLKDLTLKISSTFSNHGKIRQECS